MMDQGTQPGGFGTVGPEVTSNDKTMSLLSYLIPPIGSAIVLLSESNKARPFQKFHGTQALGLFAVYVVWEILAAIIGAIIGTASGGLLCCVGWVLNLLPAVPAIYYAYQAYQGKVFDVPVLTDFMVQQGWLKRI